MIIAPFPLVGLAFAMGLLSQFGFTFHTDSKACSPELFSECSYSCYNDDDRIVAAVLVITGAGTEEELSEYELERFRNLAVHPLPLNGASRSRLLSSGLFSAYQVAVIEDVRSREGAILSVFELSTLDGFGLDFARAVGEFVSFDYSGPPAFARAGHLVSNELTCRTSAKLAGSGTSLESVALSSGVKYRFDLDETWSATMAATGGGFFSPAVARSSGYDYSVSLSYESLWKKCGVNLSRVILGDFNMKFGQGLTMWSSMSMSGLSNITSFSKNPTGIVPYRSYSGSSVHRGAALELDMGRFTLSTALSLPQGKDGISFLPLLNAAYLGRSHQESMTIYFDISPDGKCLDAKVSADYRANVRGVDLFGEAAFDMSSFRSGWNALSIVAGTRFKACDKLDFAAIVRRYPADFGSAWSGAARSSTKCSDEHGAALAARFRGGGYVAMKPVHLLDASFDAAFHPGTGRLQLKALTDYTWQASGHLELRLRAQYRHRNYGQTSHAELRADLRWSAEAWNASARVHGLHGDSFGGLAYVEGGYKLERKTLVLRTFIRAGAYNTSGWNDRIYVYERDFPGNFNVPAMYGRGWWAGVFADIKLAKMLKIGFRYSTTRFGKHEFKFFLNLSVDKITTR